MTCKNCKNCKNCDIARWFPEHRLFNPACLYCGVRLIQSLGRLPIPASECRDRRRAALALWLKQGHSEAVIRELVKGPLAIQPKDAPTSPQTGPAGATACDSQTPPKRPSRGRK